MITVLFESNSCGSIDLHDEHLAIAALGELNSDQQVGQFKTD
jgi:hypothetical protein